MTDSSPLVITLTLPECDDETKPGTLLVGRLRCWWGGAISPTCGSSVTPACLTWVTSSLKG